MTPPYARYRDSGVALLGDVPEHWEVLPLKRAARIIMGQSPPSETYTEEPTERPFLQGNAEFGARHPKPRWYCDASPKAVSSGTLLISVRAPVGALNVADQRYGIGRGLCGIDPVPDILDPSFAWFALQTTKAVLNAVATGSTYDAVSADEVGLIAFPIPPLDEQRAIADYLDRETTRLDVLAATISQAIERLAEYRTALITAAVTGQIDVTGASA